MEYLTFLAFSGDAKQETVSSYLVQIYQVKLLTIFINKLRDVKLYTMLLKILDLF